MSSIPTGSSNSKHEKEEHDEAPPEAVVATTASPSTHVRSDSAYSMDSFVTDMAAKQEDSGHSLSPSPLHPFFNPNNMNSNNDSDGPPGEGSLVFDYTSPEKQQKQSAASAPQQLQLQLQPHAVGGSIIRDRFPSFDSMGSSGSVVRKQHSKGSTPVQTRASQQKRILPYHERRKLAKLQQLQQQKKQQQSRDATPPRPGQQQHRQQPMSPQQQEMFMMQQQQQMIMMQQQQQQMMVMQQPYMMQPPPPPPPQFFQQHSHIFSGEPPYTPDQQPQLYPPSFAPPPNYPFPPPPPPHGMPPYSPSFQQQQQQQQQQIDQPPTAAAPPRPSGARPPMQPAVPPLHQQRNRTASSGSGGERERELQWQNSSSFDSSDDAPPPPYQSSSFGPPRPKRGEGVPPPPPPPPPPLPPATHVRQDSSGSVSSLGSLDRSGREDNVVTAAAVVSSSSSNMGFFRRLNPWAPPPSPKQQTVSEFHKRNQAFLSRVDRKGLLFQSSPSPRLIDRRRPMDGPPMSRGGHRRLNSIENDDWTEPGEESEEMVPPVPGGGGVAEGKSERSRRSEAASKIKKSKKRGDAYYYGATAAAAAEVGDSSGAISSSDDSDDDQGRREYGTAADELTRLLPPTGISTNEYSDRHQRDGGGRNGLSRQSGWPRSEEDLLFEVSPETADFRNTARVDNGISTAMSDQARIEYEKQKRKKKKKRRAGLSRNRQQEAESSETSSSLSSTTSSSQNYQRWMEKRGHLLEKQRSKLIDQWKAEAKAEMEEARRLERHNRWYKRLVRCFGSSFGNVAHRMYRFGLYLEAFIANLPLTIGAIAMSSASLGVDWFKFAEENINSCQPVHFHSAQCTFPEFPGCFYCDTHSKAYKLAEHFHYACSCFAGFLAFCLIAKVFIARRVVFDELSSPTTASPAGLLCMTLDVVFAGRGFLGMLVVCTASFVHLCLAIWFIYMALAYRIMPEPTWFPNTTGLGVSAVKAWLYHPMAGHFLMAISLSLNFFFFPISLIRVFLNRKISFTVGWMQMSAPNISLYALTIMAQPSFEEEHPDINGFERVHRMVYLPCMHFLFFLCILGITASVYSLIVRWHEFRKTPFSPAHAAFCAPCLSHANAVQAYRASVTSFSALPSDSPFLLGLYIYWVIILVCGTCVTLVVSGRYLANLGEWTHFDDLEGEIEPPAPYETAMSLSHMVTYGETMNQPFVSPAVLQANEAGQLVTFRDADGIRRMRRTRKVTALGFEPIMEVIEIEQERELLLDWVSKNAPRQRNRTLSVPGVDFSYSFGTGNRGVYGMEAGTNDQQTTTRTRSYTVSPHFRKLYDTP